MFPRVESGWAAEIKAALGDLDLKGTEQDELEALGAGVTREMSASGRFLGECNI